MFGPCEICGSSDWASAYEGPIRAGAFGTRLDGGVVGLCRGCGVGRLAERLSIGAASYESDAYRAAVAQGLTVEDFFSNADTFQVHQLELALPFTLRGKTIADIGCGAGSFIDHVAGLAAEIVAVEPTPLYHDRLRERGYDLYSYTADAVKARPESVDIVVAFQVIEHVLNPREFLNEISALLKPGGVVLIATPNRDDILLKLLPDDFPKFFYRAVHRWYFDQPSMRRCVESTKALSMEMEKFFHTYTMSNALSWLSEKQPTGNRALPGIDASADSAWNAYLVSTGQSDNLFAAARKSV